MELIDKSPLVGEIERRLHFDENWIEGDKRRQKHTNGISPAYYKRVGSKHACEAFLDFINTLEVKEVQEEPVSEDLEEAAMQYAKLKHKDATLQKIVSWDFKAGAQWQKEQMLKDAVNVKINRDTLYDLKPFIHERYLDYKIGDKVKLLVIKED